MMVMIDIRALGIVYCKFVCQVKFLVVNLLRLQYVYCKRNKKFNEWDGAFSPGKENGEQNSTKQSQDFI